MPFVSLADIDKTTQSIEMAFRQFVRSRVLSRNLGVHVRASAAGYKAVVFLHLDGGVLQCGHEWSFYDADCRPPGYFLNGIEKAARSVMDGDPGITAGQMPWVGPGCLTHAERIYQHAASLGLTLEDPSGSWATGLWEPCRPSPSNHPGLCFAVGCQYMAKCIG